MQNLNALLPTILQLGKSIDDKDEQRSKAHSLMSLQLGILTVVNLLHSEKALYPRQIQLGRLTDVKVDIFANAPLGTLSTVE
jgi:hypothetical protein